MQAHQSQYVQPQLHQVHVLPAQTSSAIAIQSTQPTNVVKLPNQGVIQQIHVPVNVQTQVNGLSVSNVSAVNSLHPQFVEVTSPQQQINYQSNENATVHQPFMNSNFDPSR